MRIVLALFLLWAFPAMAVGTLDPAMASDGLLSLIRSSANTWSGTLRGYATDIFWSFAVIQLVWTFSKLALKQTDFAEFAAELIRWIVITGFFFSLVLYSVDWATAIINSFRQAAADAAGVPMQLQPGDMFAMAVELGRTVARIGLADPLTAFMVAVSAILITACFTFIGIFLMVTLIESYIVVNAGVFFMAFGGSEWTREYAMAIVRYAVSVGAKLFVLTLIVGVIMTSARTWEAAYHNDETSLLTMVCLALASCYISKAIPDMLQALINGVSAGGGSQIGGMMAAGVAGMAAGAAATSAAIGNKFMGGGVSDAIKSSFSGFTGMGGGGGSSSPGSFMNSGGGGSSGGGSSSGRSYGQSPRTGGGGYSQAPSTPPSSQPSGPSYSGGQSSSSGSNQAAANDMPASSSGTSAAQKIHAGAHMAADAAVRSVGTMGALAVPGMEGAAGTSIGPAPTPPDLTPMPGDTPENIIRPESAAPSMGEAPSDAPNSAPAPANTMASIQEVLNNRGKTS